MKELPAAGNGAGKIGRAMCVETMRKLKTMKGVGGIHILSGGKEAEVPELLASAGLS
jgi:hypothetical protein